MIELSKQYRTAGGYQVELYKIDDIRDEMSYPVLGAFRKDSNSPWVCTQWDLNGNNAYLNKEGVELTNLVEIPRFSVQCVYNKSYMKRVNYFGAEFEIPRNFNWLATDDDGALWAYVDKPYLLSIDEENSYWDYNDSTALAIASLDYKGDYKQSLLEVA